MKIASALFLGFFSATMVFLILFTFTLQGLEKPNFEEMNKIYIFGNITFWGGWLLSSYAMMKGVQTTSKVWARGSLIGAAEWVALGFSMIFKSGMSSGAEMIGASIGAGVISGFGIFVCLVTWFIASRSQAEFQQEIKRKECPQCGELIAEAAIKCRFCGEKIIHSHKHSENTPAIVTATG